MTGSVPFLMKDVVLFAASFYLLKQDVARVSRSTSHDDVVPGVQRRMAGRGLIPPS
jgi:hypothetical protein